MVFLEEYLIQGSFVILTQTIVRPINPNLNGFFRGLFWGWWSKTALPTTVSELLGQNQQEEGGLSPPRRLGLAFWISCQVLF